MKSRNTCSIKPGYITLRIAQKLYLNVINIHGIRITHCSVSKKPQVGGVGCILCYVLVVNGYIIGIGATITSYGKYGTKGGSVG